MPILVTPFLSSLECSAKTFWSTRTGCALSAPERGVPFLTHRAAWGERVRDCSAGHDDCRANGGWIP